ncbi:MAG: MATE family efflux transporter [Rikenellaceae bacterium]
MYKFSKYKEQYKLNLQLAIPIILSQLGHVVVQIIDNIMVGQYGGDNPLPLAAVSFGGSLFLPLSVASMGLSFGLTPIVGELFAQRHKGQAAKYLQNGIVLYLIVGLLISALQIVTLPLLHFLGQPLEVVEAAKPYYITLILSMLPLMFFSCFKQYLEGIGNTKIAMWCVLMSNVINIGLNWLLIGGNCGAPELGATGAGLSTLISRLFLAIALPLYVLRSSQFKAYIIRFARVNITRAALKKLRHMGIPISTQIFMEASSFVMIGIMFGWLGTNAISANQIAMSMGNATFMIVLAIGSATTIRVSHCFGANDMAQMRLASKAAWHMGLVWNTMTCIIFTLLCTQIPHIYTSNTEVVEIASILIVFIAAFQIPDGVQCVGVGILRGMQDVTIIIPFSIICYWILNIPIAYLCCFTLEMGTAGLYVGLIVGMCVASILYIWRIKYRQKKLRRGL